MKIGGMQCSFCVESIRKTFSKMDGVNRVNVNLSHEETLIEYDPSKIDQSKLQKTMKSMGYKIRDPNKIRSYEDEQKELDYHRKQLLLASLITLIALGLMISVWLGLATIYTRWFMLLLTLIMIFGVGLPILKMAIASLRRGILNQHVLMESGAIGGLIGGIIGFFIQPWPMADFMGAAIFITTYHMLSGYVSLLVRTRSSQAIKKLMDLQPQMARVIREGLELEIPIEEVLKGEYVRVRPGESIPVDGAIIEGESTVDQSLVTGESIPKIKSAGDEVIGGSINQYGSLIIEVTKIGKDSFLQQVANSIREARVLKPGILQVVERVLQYFVPAVLIAASFAFMFWTVGVFFIVGEPNFSRAIFATLAVLVMGYPCALGMATPLAMIRGGGMAAEKGILMRSGEAFQVFKDITTIAFDKTGTITKGKPKVLKVIPVNGYSEDHLIAIASTAEQPSEHPLARAIVDYAQKKNYQNDKVKVENFRVVSGLGVKIQIDQKEVAVGSPQFQVKEGINTSTMNDSIIEMESKGWTVIGVSKEKTLIGLLGIADTIKTDAIDVIQQIEENNIRPVLITGDNKRAAHFIASQVGISEVFAEVLPQEKAEKIRELQKNNNRVAMVGDGINDAPALMQSDVGIAFNAGTDIAIESADVILVNDQLSGVIDAYHIGKRSFVKTKQNVMFAFIFNGIGVPLAITGLVHPIFAMIAMVSSVSVVLMNSFGGKIIPNKQKTLKQQQKQEQIEHITYSIPSIHCQGCVNGLKEALEILPGIVSITGNPQRKTITLSYHFGRLNERKVMKTIANQGHQIKKRNG